MQRQYQSDQSLLLSYKGGNADIANSNFAGVIGPLDLTWDTDSDQWKRVMEINTFGVWLCNKYELRQMMKQESIAV